MQIDKYSNTTDLDNMMDRKEQLLMSTGFLDHNIDKAMDALTDLIATPNFDEP